MKQDLAGVLDWMSEDETSVPAEKRTEVTDPNATILLLDPGLAFGTGTHPTTALCLEWLSQADLKGKTLTVMAYTDTTYYASLSDDGSFAVFPDVYGRDRRLSALALAGGTECSG